MLIKIILETISLCPILCFLINLVMIACLTPECTMMVTIRTMLKHSQELDLGFSTGCAEEHRARFFRRSQLNA